MRIKQKLMYVALGALVVVGWQAFSDLTVSDVVADEHGRMSATVKYVYAIDYPLGGKAQYLGVKSIADALQAPEELSGLASYDNYLASLRIGSSSSSSLI